jgi:RNAse (barnase) inhibitor barstar
LINPIYGIDYVAPAQVWSLALDRRSAKQAGSRLLPQVQQTRSKEGVSVGKVVYEIDGLDFTTLEEFYGVVSRVLIPGAKWGHNLDAFNDILRGGFGTPEGGFILRWKNSGVSRERLGYPETVRQLDRRLTRCHPGSRQAVGEELDRARLAVGPTVFDWLVELIEIHCTGSVQQGDGVELVLD